MSNNQELGDKATLICDLMNYGDKGINWKVIPASSLNHVVLIYGILSLANTIFPGDRYLIIADNNNDTNFYNDWFEHLSFSGGIRPEITISNIEATEGSMLVVSISDSRNKPFCLDEMMTDGRHTVWPGTIYSHQMSGETAEFARASFRQTENIWRDRFGLGPSPKDYVVRFLQDRHFWEVTNSGTRIYKLNRQFSVTVSKSEVTGGVYWWTEQFSGLAVRRLLRLRFGGHIISTVPLVQFKASGLTVPFPDFDEIVSPRKSQGVTFCRDIFYYIKGSLKFALLFNLLGERYQEIVTGIASDDNEGEAQIFPIIVFNNEAERMSFIVFLQEHIGKFDAFLETEISNEVIPENDIMARDRHFTLWAYRQYLVWPAGKNSNV
ncbi:hypothetical protein [Cedecea sp. P7760]|uniref:hypothetical protein n=1 Tax=Cedecea sp. P7760 TaxID=2726983 RepID=UPI0015A07AE5|nr:hypothetical protein [Cedecea sp. P7760]NWC64130.1 hypothetical protein [Cedecea sp. P7760]